MKKSTGGKAMRARGGKSPKSPGRGGSRGSKSPRAPTRSSKSPGAVPSAGGGTKEQEDQFGNYKNLYCPAKPSSVRRTTNVYSFYSRTAKTCRTRTEAGVTVCRTRTVRTACHYR